MPKLKSRVLNFWSIALIASVLLLGGAVGTRLAAQPANANPYANAEIVGNPDGATLRALLAPAANANVRRIVYFSGFVTPVSVAGTVTPVLNSPTQCLLGNFSIYRADAILTGTMTGTAPTAALLWQNSIDGGNTWNNVGTWTTINATVTPASQSQVVSDIVGSTAVSYGDCWRAQITFGGTGSVGVNLKVAGFDK